MDDTQTACSKLTRDLRFYLLDNERKDLDTQLLQCIKSVDNYEQRIDLINQFITEHNLSEELHAYQNNIKKAHDQSIEENKEFIKSLRLDIAKYFEPEQWTEMTNLLETCLDTELSDIQRNEALLVLHQELTAKKQSA